MFKLFKRLWHCEKKQVAAKEEEIFATIPSKIEFHENEMLKLMNSILEKRLSYDAAWFSTIKLRKQFAELDKLGLSTKEYLLNPDDDALPLLGELKIMAEEIRRNRKEHKRMKAFLRKNVKHQVFEQQDVRKIFFELN